ncbi:hypothetical protein NP493_357g00002 [Ridgeia piscesae]|uniref:DNA replication ATP-dependent helicase/nuclease n=1 Tax=Ridgeia piscesae TaxID=27915 RepID=A0AAD9L3F4_RIDPI|nr:hypothetical protein NP493_357g00002 [Ridgeia piscesae]
MAGVSRREDGNAVERVRIKLDMQEEQEFGTEHQNLSATKGNIPLGKHGDITKESTDLGDGERLGEKTGSMHIEPVEVGSHDGQKEGEETDEDKGKEGCQSGPHPPYRWNSRRKSNVCTKPSPEDGVQTSDSHRRDATLSDILSELKGPNVTNQRQSSDKTTSGTKGRLKYDLCREDRRGHDPHKHNCVDVASKPIETDVTIAKVRSGNHGDTDLMEILSELKEQFAVTQSPCEKKRQKPPGVTNRSVDQLHTTADITSDLASSSSVASITLGGDTSLDDIMRELVPARATSTSDRVLVRNVKVSKRTKINTPRNSTQHNCNNKENGARSTREMMTNLKVEESTDIQAVDTSGANTMTTETSSDSTDVTQPLSGCHVTSKHDAPVKPRDEFPETTDDLDSTLMKNFQLDDSLENELNYDFEKMSPFKTAQRNRSCTIKKWEDIPPATAGSPCQHFGRHRVLGVSRHRDEVRLTVKGDIDGTTKTVVLQGFWIDTHVVTGDVVNVLGKFDQDDICKVTNTQNMIVVNPDLLISGTVVVSGVFCMRKSVLNEKFKGCEGRNIYMLYGSIIHSVFQKVLQKKAFSETAMKEVAEEILTQSKFLHEMYGQAVTENSLMEEIEKYLPPLRRYVETYVSSSQSNSSLRRKPQVSDVITKVVDVEENIWSPRFGIKGKIDLTVEVKSQKDQTTKVVPLELKTGKATYSVEHQGQVTLYSMMMSDRRRDPDGGLLLYLKEGDMKVIPAGHANKRGLIQLRNELAHFMKSSSEKCDAASALASRSWPFGDLPEPISRGQFCSKCPQLLNCAAVQRCVEERAVPDDHPMTTLVPTALSHLSPSHLAYFSLWMTLTHLELGADSKKKGLRGLWCHTGAERELAGSCLSGMRLVASKCCFAAADVYELTFSRSEKRAGQKELSDIGLSSGDSVVISAENKPLISLATGFLQLVTDHRVTLVTTGDLQNCGDLDKLVFRLDKCDNFNSMGTNLGNISRLLADNATSAKLRELVINRRQPTFDLTLSKTTITKVKHIFKSLNKPQKAAILKVLMCKDYILIKGYPGTGKTSTIVALVRILVTLGQSVLLTSYTHSAVDNILLKLRQFDLDIVRIGRLAKIHTDIRPFAAETLTAGFKTVQELDDFYLSKSVVVTTCLGTNHAVFSRRVFDVCIVDEASQVLQPACLGPLLASRRFVLVGDPLQLPPVVQSREARDLGMEESLFARLDDTGGTYELDLQYRMNSAIMRLSNELVYSGALRCASETVATGRLNAQNFNILHEVDLPIWMKTALSPGEGQEVIFLDTDKIPCQETEADRKVKNRAEAMIILTLTQQIIQCGVSPSDIGIIAPYQQQVRLLRDFMHEHHLVDVEVNTVDQYQGRDKAAIFMSFVKSRQEDGATGGILSDLRRLNVALTRAKHKLVLVGCVQALRPYRSVAKLLDILDTHQMIALPETTLHQCSRMLDPDTSMDHCSRILDQ